MDSRRLLMIIVSLMCPIMFGCQTVYQMFAGTFRVADKLTGDYDENLQQQGIDPERARREFYKYDR